MAIGFNRLHELVTGEGFGYVPIMGQLVHDALFFPLLPRFVKVGGIDLPIGCQRVAIQGLLAFMQDKRRTQQLQGLGNLLESTGIPKTDSGVKKSAKGLLRVEKEGDNFVLYDEQTPEQEQQGEMKEVFRDGELLVSQSLEEIRKRLYG